MQHDGRRGPRVVTELAEDRREAGGEGESAFRHRRKHERKLVLGQAISPTFKR